jgi:hypothetical protein
MITWVRVVIGLAALVAVAIVVGVQIASKPPSGSFPGLHDLGGIDQLAAAFNRDAGEPRVILLLSPT